MRVLLLAALLLGSSEGLEGKRPNLILVITDDQGYGDVGRHGNPILRTPNLDRLYDESVRFDDFRVSPTCAPTRASIFTGRHEFRSGVTHTISERERLSLKATTMAQVLKTAGYATGIFGKWHLGDEEPYRPDKRGFDEVFIHGAGGIGQSYPGSCGDAPKNSYFDPVILHNGVFEKTAGYCTDVFFAQAMKWIEATKGSKPFYCHLATNAPHEPHQVPPEYEKQYSDKVPKAETAKYLGMVANLDDNVGRLLAKLAALSLERETLVVFMSDNGGTDGCEVWNAGMKGRKGSPDNGGTRAISFWRWPGTLKPATVSKLTAHVDIFPTFAALAGAPAPAGIDGYSLLPLLENPAAAWHEDRMLFTHVGRWPVGGPPAKNGPSSVRWRNYLWVRAPKPGLYDLAADPGETKDLSGAQPEMLARLAKAYDAWWEEILPCLENEGAQATAPKVNPFKALYWKQYGGPGPNQAPPPAEK